MTFAMVIIVCKFADTARGDTQDGRTHSLHEVTVCRFLTLRNNVQARVAGEQTNSRLCLDRLCKLTANYEMGSLFGNVIFSRFRADIR